jgi:catecholate siderophore receptor
VIEQDSKAPIQTQSFLTTQAEVGTDETHRLTGDANTPVGDGAGAFRLNAMVHENNVAGRDEAHGSRWGFAPSLLLNIDPATQFKLDYYHQYEHDRPDYGIPWFNGKPAPVPRNNFYGFSSDFLHTAVNMLTVGVTHQFSPDVQLSSRLRYSEGSREFRTSEGVVPTGTPASTPPDAIKLNRNEFSLFDDDRMWQEDTDLTARFATGVLRHSLVAGVEVGEEISDPSYIFFTGVPATTLIDPPSQVFSDTARYNRLAVATDSHFVGVYALDTIDIGSHLQLIGGLRWDRFASAFDAVAHASPTAAAVNSNFNHVDAMPSYRAAVIYKPIPSASLYFTYGTSFDPSTEGIDSAVSSGHSAAIAYAGLAPETSQSFEGGAKWNVNPRLLATAAVFDIDMNNVRIPSPTTSAFDVLGGNAVVRGFELEASGHLTDRLETRIGYAYLDSETTKSAPGGSLLGSPLIVTPKDTFNLVAEYRVLKQVAVGGDIQMTTDRLGMNTAASYQRAPGYAIGGLMARYTPNDRIKVQINIYNLTDAYYYDQPQSFHVIPGAGRSAKLTLSSKF